MNMWKPTASEFNFEHESGWCTETFIKNGSINLSIKLGFAGVRKSYQINQIKWLYRHFNSYFNDNFICNISYICSVQLLTTNLYHSYLSIGRLFTTQYTENHWEPELRILDFLFQRGLCWAVYHFNQFIHLYRWIWLIRNLLQPWNRLNTLYEKNENSWSLGVHEVYLFSLNYHHLPICVPSLSGQISKD